MEIASSRSSGTSAGRWGLSSDWRWALVGVILAIGVALQIVVGVLNVTRPPPLPTLDPLDVGVVVGNTAGRPDLIDELADTGVGWVRLDLYWNTTETAPGRYDWWIASDIDRALARGLNVYLSVHGTPSWATDGPPSTPPRELSDWESFLEAAVERFPDVAVWGIWNEPNEEGFWSGTDEEYLELVRVAAPVVHGASKRLAAPDAASSPEAREFVERILEGAGDRIDILSVHHYGLASDARRLIRSLPGSKPVWLTEAGFGANQTEEQQAEHMRELLGLQSRTERWEVSIFYHWYTDQAYPIMGTEAERVLSRALRDLRED